MKLPSFLTSFLAVMALIVGVQFLPISQVQAQITNPAIGDLGKYDPNVTGETASGAQFVGFFAGVWRSITIIGALAVIIYFVWGGIDWIVAGGDAGKVGKARDKMTQAVIGLIILVSSFVIIGFLGQLFFGPNFDILRLDITGAGTTGTTTGTSGTGSSGTGGSGTGGTGGTAQTVPAGECTTQVGRCVGGIGYHNPVGCQGTGTGPIMCGLRPIPIEDRDTAI